MVRTLVQRDGHMDAKTRDAELEPKGRHEICP